jgi:hypothetical protein
MCQSTNCCVTCCTPTNGKGWWVLLAVALAASFALVCAWAFIAIRVDAIVLLRAARVRPADMPTVVCSWWSPTARHLLARQVARGRVVLPAGPGAIQATMAALALAVAGLVAWICCGCPVPAPVRRWLQARARVVGARVPVPASVRATISRSRHLPPARLAPAAASARIRAALPPPTSTAKARPRVAALPPPVLPPTPTSTVLPPLRFIHLARPQPKPPDPDRTPATRR